MSDYRVHATVRAAPQRERRKPIDELTYAQSLNSASRSVVRFDVEPKRVTAQ
jgi:hypothetical protein